MYRWAICTGATTLGIWEWLTGVTVSDRFHVQMTIVCAKFLKNTLFLGNTYIAIN
jgi:hypothetical protein